MLYFFFFNDTATTEIYTLSLHDALPIWRCISYRSGGKCLSEFNTAPEADVLCKFRLDRESKNRYVLEPAVLRRGREGCIQMHGTAGECFGRAYLLHSHVFRYPWPARYIAV